MKKKLLQNIIFDMDGVIRGISNPTVTQIITDELSQYSSKYGQMTLCEFVSKYLPMECFHMWDKGLVNKDYVLNEILKVCDEPKDLVKYLFNQVLQRSNNYIYNKTIDFIHYLKSNGYKLYILSNMCHEIVELLKTMIDFSVFDGVIYSCDIGLRKPEIEFYTTALKIWNISAKDSIFIDDNNKNLLPFKSLGGTTYLFDNIDIDNSVRNIKQLI